MSVWYTAPTAVRMMMKVGADVAREHRPSALAVHRQRRVSHSTRRRSAGARKRSASRSTTTGGRPRPGGDHDRQLRRDGHPSGLDGSAAARDRRGDPSPRRARARGRARRRRPRSSRSRWSRASSRCAGGGRRCFAATSASPIATQRCFAGDWYLSGDLAMRDADGYFWFVGRGDDVIKSAGHLIGPFEVESALMEHPAVAEAGVIGKPDPVAGELVKAFVVLRPGSRADRRAPSGADRVRPLPARSGHRAQGARVPSRPPEDPQREDHAPVAAGTRARSSRR